MSKLRASRGSAAQHGPCAQPSDHPKTPLGNRSNWRPSNAKEQTCRPPMKKLPQKGRASRFIAHPCAHGHGVLPRTQTSGRPHRHVGAGPAPAPAQFKGGLGWAWRPIHRSMAKFNLNAQLITHTPDRLDRGFGRGGHGCFELFAQPGDQLLQRMLAHQIIAFIVAIQITHHP